MSECSRIRGQFSGYLDGAITGAAMQQIARHLDSCATCSGEFAAWRGTQSALAALGPAKAPADLALRLRVALSQEAANTPRQNLARWRVRWQNSFRPLVLQASAGLASSILLVGSVALLVGMFATPEPLQARDEPLGMASTPRFLYTTFDSATSIGDHVRPVVVEAFVNGEGRVYDFHIVSGPDDARTRSQLESMLLFSVFAPARVFGQPVSGTVIMAFSGVSVRG